jgi:hypothetical protein
MHPGHLIGIRDADPLAPYAHDAARPPRNGWSCI